jgi:hypothetical protein
MMTAADFDTAAMSAQRWLAALRPKDVSGSWRAAQSVLLLLLLLSSPPPPPRGLLRRAHI